MGLLDRLWKRPEESRLTQLLKSYPPYVAPFAGPPRSWTLEQANANLAYLQQNKAERIAALRQVLSEFAIEVPSDLAVEDPQPLLNALNAWALKEWPRLPAPAAGYDTWIASSRSASDIVLSLLMDVAILLGEMVIAHRPKYVWGIDLDPDSDMDGMESFLRPVVHTVRPMFLDFEAMVVGSFLNMRRNPDWKNFNHLGWSVTGAIAGGYEPV